MNESPNAEDDYKNHGVLHDSNTGVVGGYVAPLSAFGYNNVLVGASVKSYYNTYNTWGSSNASDAISAIEPFRKGLFFTKILRVPPLIDNKLMEDFIHYFEKSVQSFSGIQDVSLVTTETVKMNPIGKAMTYIVGLTNDNGDFTLGVQVTKGLGFLRMMEHWVYGIVDPKTGYATMNGKNLPLIRYNYSMDLIYICNGPTGSPSDIEGAWFFAQCVPTSPIPYSLLDGGTVSEAPSVTPTHDITFSGYCIKCPEVDILAQQIIALRKGNCTSWQDDILPEYLYSSGYFNKSLLEDVDFQNTQSMRMQDRIQSEIDLLKENSNYTQSDLDTSNEWKDKKDIDNLQEDFDRTVENNLEEAGQANTNREEKVYIDE